MFKEGGAPSYGELVKKGVEIMKYKGRPTPEDMIFEVQRIAQSEARYDGKQIYGTDTGAFVERKMQETNKIVRERFERVIQDRSVDTLKGTLWEHWTVEDCKDLLQSIAACKEQIKLESDSVPLYGVSLEEKLKELDMFAAEGKSEENIDESLRQVETLVLIVEKVIKGDKDTDYLRKKYDGWTDEQLQQFYDKAKNICEDMLEYEENMPRDYDY